MRAESVFWLIACQCVRNVLCLATKPGRGVSSSSQAYALLSAHLILFLGMHQMVWAGSEPLYHSDQEG